MQKVIDIHCHMFNLKYLPVAGILSRYSHKYIPDVIAFGVEWLLLKNTNESFTGKNANIVRPNKLVDENNPLYTILNEEKFIYKIEDVFDFKADDSITAIVHMAYVSDIIGGKLSDAINAFEKIQEAETGISIKTEFANEDAKIKYKAGLLRQMINWIKKQADALTNYLKWFVFMTYSEEDIYRHITTRDGKVELFLHMMMDVDYFFNDGTIPLKYKSHFDFEKMQISNMQKLNSNHRELIGFVAFNPSRPNYMEVVKTAIETKGFKGVKFYPPLGYRADGDSKYSAQIEKLLAYCSVNKIPLFTHCNNKGFEAWPKPEFSGYNSNPKYWEAALIKHPDLILCLGHAGGTEGWFGENKLTDKLDADTIICTDIKDDKNLQTNWNNSYASMVYKLCVKYKNVYCDASYLDELMTSDGSFDPTKKDNFKKRLLKLFTKEPNSPSDFKFQKKIMYGSDLHMLFQDGKNNVYLKSYLQLFSEAELLPFSEDFFYNNATRFLNLNITS